VHLVFAGNTEAQTQAVAHVMMAMMVGLLPFGWLYLVQRVYYAYEDARTPFYLQLVVTAVATTVNLVAFTVEPGRAGVVVGIGQTVSNLVAAGVGFALLRRRFGLLRLRMVARLYARLVVAAGLAAGLTWPLVHWLQGALPGGRAGAAVELVVGGGVYAIAALGLAHLMRVEEVAQLLDPLVRRLRRRPS
jgi:putative peptidoglycan lipid II flippase